MHELCKNYRLLESNGVRPVIKQSSVVFCCLIFNWPYICVLQSLVIPEKFQHILRILSTNIDGKRKVMFAMTAIKGIGRRFSNIVLKKADVDLNKRAGECTDEEVCTIFILLLCSVISYCYCSLQTSMRILRWLLT